jgi:hypothetical protein
VKIRGVVFQTDSEQFMGGDDLPAYVGGITWPREGVPVRVNFDPNKPLGQTTKIWVEDGRLLFEAEIHVMPPTTHWIPCAGLGTTRVTKGKGIEEGKLYEISLCDENKNKNQPPATLIK